ncbi:LPS export ABC transporter permease LptG [Marinicellulosiphila megalodicopiae]|uniref:LPS export ABC transporter permease LptG n=1 Tax=Marinicellulosiphila megalodicopiae TaxID=2724896 RepID=UPI003BB126D0
MNILSRYLTKQVFLAMMLVFLFMTSFFFLLRFLEEVNYELAGNYQFKEAFNYILLTTPEITYEYMPFIIMIGCLFSLGNLSNQNELTILRAAGMSIVTIVRPVFMTVGLLLTLVVMINEWVTPKLSHHADVLKQSAASQGGSSRYGEWKKEEGQFIYIGSVDRSDIFNVQSFEFFGNKLVQTQKFDQLEYQNNWQSQAQSVTWQFDQQNWIQSNNQIQPNYSFDPEILQANQLRENLLSMHELYKLMLYGQTVQINNARFAVAFYTKFFMPIITLALVWVCSIFVFGSTRKTAIGARIFVGLLVGVTLKLLQNLMSPLVINFSFSPIWVGIVPLLIILALGFYLQRKLR